MVVDYLRDFKNLTYTEASIRDYILDNPQLVAKLTIKELSKECNVGMASIIRFCKKIGFGGFSDFKVAFLKEYREKERIDKGKKTSPFDQNTTTKDIINDLPFVYDKAIGYTQLSIDENVLHRVVGRIQNSTVLIFGTGINKSVGNIFAYKIEGLGILCKTMDSLHYQLVDTLHLKDIPMFGILLSRRGQNEAIITVAKFLKKRKIPSLLICCQMGDEIREYVDEVLYTIPTYTTKDFASTQFMMSEQYILDVIYSMLFVKNLKLVDNLLKYKGYRMYQKGEQNE